MFSTEQELVQSITTNLDAVPDLLGTGKRSVFTELDLGYGIADVVAVSYEESPSQRKNFLQYFDISLLSLIEKEERVSLDDIVYITRSPERRINSALTSLMEEEFIVYRHGYYTSHKKYAELLTDSVAIEAKLKDWKRALKQAYRYKWFADKSYVFVPSENINLPLANINLFEKYNVGLASVSETSGIEVVHAPFRERPYSERMRMALNEHLLANNDTCFGGIDNSHPQWQMVV
jgi:hypothetical protein